ncbi:MAG: sortase, partial [Firmicutes bacterium]|nr:sortase [Bacillota bacterium]
GAIYLSCMNSKDFSDSYNMIYGHHMDNGAMFGDIDHFVEKEYFDAHRTGTLILPDGSTYDLNVFACVATDAYENAVYSVGNRDLGGVVAFARSNALQYEAGIGEAASKICVLSTCASGETNGRLVLYAAMDLRNDAPSGRDGDKAVVAEDEDPSDADGSDIIDDADPLNNGSENADIAEEESTEVEENDIPAAVMNIDTDDPGNGTPGEAEEIGRIEEIEEEEVPLAKFFDQFTPTGGSVGSNAWALVNLICLVVTVYLFLPVLHIRDKFSRGRKMRRFNEEQGSDLYEEERFTRRFRLGVALELADCILAVIAFLMTEDVTRPMTLIDRWTPLMILFLALCLIVDLRLVSYRGEDPEDGNVSMQLGAGAAQPAK